MIVRILMIRILTIFLQLPQMFSDQMQFLFPNSNKEEIENLNLNNIVCFLKKV